MSRILKVYERKNISAFLLILLITEGLGFLSGAISGPSRQIYKNLVKPPFAPPAWIFPVVWLLLYFLMAYSVFLIWKKGQQGADIRMSLTLYAVQLILNILWPIVFFRLKLYGLAFFEILLLIFFIIITTLEFYRKDKSAGRLMLPYLLWVIYAAVLNYSIWLLNT